MEKVVSQVYSPARMGMRRAFLASLIVEHSIVEL